MTGISEIELQNFKCFRRQPIQFGPLTIFAGLNGMGKSTVIQALLLLRQSMDQTDRPIRLRLSGDLVDLGTGADVFFDLAEEREIGILLEIDHLLRYECDPPPLKWSALWYGF